MHRVFREWRHRLRLLVSPHACRNPEGQQGDNKRADKYHNGQCHQASSCNQGFITRWTGHHHARLRDSSLVVLGGRTSILSTVTTGTTVIIVTSRFYTWGGVREHAHRVDKTMLWVASSNQKLPDFCCTGMRIAFPQQSHGSGHHRGRETRAMQPGWLPITDDPGRPGLRIW